MDTEMTCYESFAEVTEGFYCSAVDVLKILVLRLHDYHARCFHSLRDALYDYFSTDAAPHTNALRILWLLPIIAIQIASIAVCYVAQYHAADEYFPDYMVGLMAVLLLINILIVFYVEALRENELEKFKAKFNEQQYNLQMEYYQQLKERQEEVRSLRHDVKKYILAMQAVAEHGDTEELHKIAQAATDIFERSTKP